MTKTTTLSSFYSSQTSPASLTASPLNMDDKVLLYALGDLKGKDEQAFEAMLFEDPNLIEGVARFEHTLQQIKAMPLVTPSKGTMASLWGRMQQMHELSMGEPNYGTECANCA